MRWGLIVALLFGGGLAFADYDMQLQKAFSSKVSGATHCSQLIINSKVPVHGQDTVTFTLNTQGRIKTLSYKSQMPGTQNYGKCLQAALKKATFPLPIQDDYQFEGSINWGPQGEGGSSAGGSDAASKARDLVMKTAEKNLPSFQSCYNDYLKSGGKKSGEITLRWSVGDTGDASDVRVIEDKIGSPLLGTCLIAKTRALPFPKPPKNTSLEIERYSFVFFIKRD